MQTNELTQEYVRQLFNYNPETGSFTWRVSISNRAPARSEVGSLNRTSKWNTRVKQTRIHGRKCAVASVIWLWVYGHYPKGPPDEVVDHIDRNPENNKLSNLRLVSKLENDRNRGLYNNGFPRKSRGY